VKIRVLRHGKSPSTTRTPREPLFVSTSGSLNVAFAWYTSAQWAELRATADDPEALDDSYQAWLSSAEQALADLQARGVAIVPFQVVVADARKWARERGMRFDSAARAAYVTDAMRAAGE